MSAAKRHQLILFFVLAYALAWAMWIPAVVLQESFPSLYMPLFTVGVLAPTVSAILLTGLLQGKGQVKALFRRLLKWRVNVVWYLVALLGPPILVLLVTGLHVLLGGAAPNLGGLLMLLPTFLFITVFSGPLAEEVGWRGYALPRLQAGQTALTASLILGIIWAAWHLPLFLLEGVLNSQIPVGAFLVLTVSLTVLFTWVYNNTGGSLLMVLLLHGMVNTAPATIFGQAIADPRLFWLYAGSVGVVAILVILLTGPEHLSRKHHKQEESAEEPVVATSTPHVT